MLFYLTLSPDVRSLWRRFPIGSVDTRVRYGIFSRPHYAYGVYWASWLAKRLKLDGISAIEFGVAGGRGLLALQSIARVIGDDMRIRIAVAGFDSGTGLPEPLDYRDLPHIWGKGFHLMDEPKLRAKLSPATELVLGEVKETVPRWLSRSDTLPLGFVAFDLDYYSSTLAALRVFDNENVNSRLPRVYCYFDDIIWPEPACHNEYTGELRAIREFNERHEHQKLCPLHRLDRMRAHQEIWNHQIYVLHDFTHPLYCTNVTPSTDEYTQKPLIRTKTQL
jgi:hypothetical protein